MSARRPACRRAAAILAAGVLAACATVQAPPGGPVDRTPPQVLSISPDTGSVNVRPKEVVFRFDEVVNERPAAAAQLDQMFVISPSDGAARVSWHRSSITVRPRRDFRPNTAYTVTMLPGMADLRGNTLRTGATTFFSTGPEIPRTSLSGVVFDWVAGRPAVGALVEAFQGTDTTFAWTAVTDSSGRFTLRAFPSGSYLVRGLLDANHNRVLDPREMFDTVRVAVADSAKLEILAFAHDTIGPRIDQLTVEDSVTIAVTFDKPLDPARPLSTSNFTIRRADSTAIPIAAVLTDSAFNAERATRDSIRADSIRRAPRPAADSTAAAPPSSAPTTAQPGAGSAVPLPRGGLGRTRRAPVASAPADSTRALKPSRPSPQSKAVLRLEVPLTPITAYRVRAIDLRGLASNPRTSDRVFATAKPPSADSAAVPGKSPGARPAPTRPPGKP